MAGRSNLWLPLPGTWPCLCLHWRGSLMHWMIHGSRESEIGSEKDGQRLQGHLSIQQSPPYPTARDESFVRSQGLGSGQAGMQMPVPLRVRPEPTGDVRERRPHARRKHDLPPLPPGSVSFGFIYFTQIEVF